jgi:hypothetical protein
MQYSNSKPQAIPVDHSYSNQGKNKMSPLRRALAKWLLGVNDATPPIKAVNTLDSDPSLNFKIYEAIGGKVVEFSRYDHQRNEHIHQIYVVGKDENFGEKISKISMLEVMR